jgi:hypothetical protein
VARSPEWLPASVLPLLWPLPRPPLDLQDLRRNCQIPNTVCNLIFNMKSYLFSYLLLQPYFPNNVDFLFLFFCWPTADIEGTVSRKSWRDKAMKSKSRLQLRIATGF